MIIELNNLYWQSFRIVIILLPPKQVDPEFKSFLTDD